MDHYLNLIFLMKNSKNKERVNSKLFHLKFKTPNLIHLYLLISIVDSKKVLFIEWLSTPIDNKVILLFNSYKLTNTENYL